jgi:hypothetical protein
METCIFLRQKIRMSTKPDKRSICSARDCVPLLYNLVVGKYMQIWATLAIQFGSALTPWLAGVFVPPMNCHWRVQELNVEELNKTIRAVRHRQWFVMASSI